MTGANIAWSIYGGGDVLDNHAAPLQHYPMTRVRYFGPLTELSGTDEEQLEIAFPIIVGELRTALEQKHPALSGQSFRIAVDAVIRESNSTVAAAGEIACLAAFAGG